ncbi:lipopolysaccharide biosynthesis protein [Clostridium baratii]
MKINFIFYIINIIIMFISRSIFIKILGANITGLNSLYTSLIGLLNVAELGVGVAIGYSLYKPLSEKNYQKIKDIMILFKYYYNRIAKIIFIFGILISFILPFLIKGQVDLTYAYIYYFMYLLNCVISYMFTYKQTLIIADQKQYKIAYILNISKIIKVLFQCFIIVITRSFFAWLLLEIIFNIISMYLANKKIDNEYYVSLKYTNNKNISIIKNENIEIGKNIKNMFFHKIASFVIYQTDVIVISAFSTLKETAIYANYMMIINALSGLISTAIGSIMPSIGNLIAEKSDEDSYNTFKILYLFDNILALFICIVTYEIINKFITFWIGPEYLFSNYIVLAIIINLYIQISRGSVDRFKDGYGIYWDIYAPIIESIVNLIFSIYLAYKFGIIGVFIGTIISNFIIVILWKPYILFKIGFKKKISLYIRQACYIYFFNISIWVILNYIYKNYLNLIYVNNLFLNMLIHFILVSLLCLMLIFIFYFKNKEFKKLLKIINNQVLAKIVCKLKK